jgi:hypothetical protein
MTGIAAAIRLPAVRGCSTAQAAEPTIFGKHFCSGPLLPRPAIAAALLIGFSLPAAAMSPAAPKSDMAAVGTSAEMSAAMRSGSRRSAEGVAPSSRQWSVQLAGSFSKDRARASFASLRDRHRDALGGGSPIIIDTPYGNRGPSAFYRVRLPTASRMAAVELCDKLHSAGEGCVVLSTP